MSRREYDRALDRKCSLERRKAILLRAMEAESPQATRVLGAATDRWLDLAGLYDRCSEQIGECESIIEAWEEEHPSPDYDAIDRAWYHSRVL